MFYTMAFLLIRVVSVEFYAKYEKYTIYNLMFYAYSAAHIETHL